MRGLSAGLVVLLVGSVGAGTSLGAEFLSGQNVVIAADQVWEDDVYVFAQTLVVEGEIKGDLVVSAQQVHLRGDIGGSLTAACQQLLIEGTCGRASRIACHTARIAPEARLAGDVVAAAYSLDIAKGAVVDGDLIYAGYQILLQGQILDDVWAAVSRAEITGSIGRELSITAAGTAAAHPVDTYWNVPPGSLLAVPPVTSGLTIHPEARIGSGVVYRSPEEAEIASDASIGGEVQWLKTERLELSAGDPRMRYFWAQVRRYGTLLVLGGLMVMVCPTTTRGTVDEIAVRPGVTFLAGLLAIPMAVVAVGVIGALVVLLPMLFAMVTMDHLAVASAAIMFFSLLMYVASLLYFVAYGAAAILSITFGRLIFSDQPIISRGGQLLALAFGLIFFILLTCIPYLDIGVMGVALLFGFGGLFTWLVRGMFFAHETRLN